MLKINPVLSNSGIRRAILVTTMIMGIGSQIATAQIKTSDSEETDRFELTTDSISTKQNTTKPKTLNFDAAVRRFEIFGNKRKNLITGSFGVSKKWGNKLSGYAMVQGGYDTRTRKPLIGTMEFLDYKYTNTPTCFSAELYHESLFEKKIKTQKIAVTPIKFSTPIADKASLCIDPRFALNYNGKKFEPKVETLLTVSAALAENTSLYWILQQYDAVNIANPSTWGFNTGIIFNLSGASNKSTKIVK